MANVNYDDSYDNIRPYHVVVSRYWFRKKPVFGYRMSDYERKLKDVNSVQMSFSAGNIIYQMMKKLRPTDFDKQNALVYAYRNLMYKISYVTVVWRRKDMDYLHLSGRKGDVMWALSFLSQVYTEMPIICQTIPENKNLLSISFQLQNGHYIGQNARQNVIDNDVVPDIWSQTAVQKRVVYQQMSRQLIYDPNFRPKDGDRFALPDGCIGLYISQDQRFFLAEKFGPQMDIDTRHRISVSLMKDFEDMMRRQTLISYDLYQVRYSAFMNKVHLLESKLKGLDVSVYDTLPVGERGLPQAALDTIQRTNMMDKDSLRYINDKISRNIGRLSQEELKQATKEASHSIVSRLRGYHIEYYMYTKDQTPENLCQKMHQDRCFELYEDFIKLEAYGELVFPMKVYKVLCNEPERHNMTISDVDRMILDTFGRGYLSYLQYRLSQSNLSTSKRGIYSTAFDRLRTHMK